MTLTFVTSIAYLKVISLCIRPCSKPWIIVNVCVSICKVRSRLQSVHEAGGDIVHWLEFTVATTLTEWNEFPSPSLNTSGSFCFELCSGQTNRRRRRTVSVDNSYHDSSDDDDGDGGDDHVAMYAQSRNPARFRDRWSVSRLFCAI